MRLLAYLNAFASISRNTTPILMVPLFCLLLLLFVVVAGTADAQGDSVIHIPGGIYIDNVQFARGGTHLLARENDTVKVWGIPSGEQIGVSIVLSSTKGYAAFLPGDTTILTVAYASDSVFNIWDWRTGKRLKSVSLFRPISEAFATADGQTLAILVSFPQRQYELWNIAAGTYRETVLYGKYNGLLLDTSGNYGVVNNDRVLNCINVATHTVDAFHIDLTYLSRSCFSRDGSRIGFSMVNRSPLIFSITSRDSLFSLDIAMSDSLDIIKGIRTYVTMGLSDDNHYIATITERGAEPPRLNIWDGVDGHPITEFAPDPRIRLGLLKVSPRNDYVAIYSLNTGMYLWPLSLSPSTVPVVAGVAKKVARWFPNPAASDVTVEWKEVGAGPGKLTILTPEGKIMRTVTWKSHGLGLCRENLSTAGWASGQYFGVIETGEGD